MEKLIKILLAILLFLCLFRMSYGFYELVRLVALVGFAFLAYRANNENRKNEVFLYCTLALLFQPFIKIALGRDIWNILDVIVGVGLIVSLFMNRK